MHYFALVLVPADTEDIETLVADIMSTYNEENDQEDGWWDWYRIGGRWDGIVQGVDRYQECVRCQANNIDCHYSHEHEQIKHNVAPVAEVGECKAYTVVTEAFARHRETWRGGHVVDEDWPRTLGTILLDHRDYVAVVVDYHS